MKKNNIRNKKRILIMIFMLLFVVISGTYAWYSYRTNETAMVLTVGDLRKLRVTLTPYQINTTFSPTTGDYSENEYVQVTAVNNKVTEARFSLYYQIDNIDSNLISEYFKYTILRSEDNGTTYEEYLTGDFSNAEVEENLFIFSQEIVPSGVTYLYKVYLWIDGSETDNSSMAGASFEGELRANVSSTEQIIVDVAEGLIPVTIADNGAVTTIASDDTLWYDYDEQKWANAVLVTESSRDSYLTSGTTVNSADILGYYVYIPRFSYAFINADGEEESILIMFENVNEYKLVGDATKDNYLTHPAFTFGGGEVNGIWVGKFETTGTADEPTVLPGVEPLNGQTVSSQFISSLKFAGGSLTNGIVDFSGSTTYGLTEDTDSHMMKNSEWGAVAYLTHSIYGINSEVRLNNYADNSSGSYVLQTGCGAETENEAVSSTCSNSYGSSISEYPQSTTGNITGIFDMAGGGWDAVMAVTAYSDGTPYSGQLSDGNSGFNGYVCNATYMANCTNDYYGDGIQFPIDTKYYDLYTSYSKNTACDGGICYGHAFSETSGWYGDTANFPNHVPWTYRGSNFISKTSSGIFAYSRDQGTEGTNGIYSFRSVLLETPEVTYPTVTLLSNVNISDSSDGAAGSSVSTIYGYTGSEATFNPPATTNWYLKTWGAAGGYASSNSYTGSNDISFGTYVGGNGGYARGFIETGDTMYINVGGKGGSTYAYYGSASAPYSGYNNGDSSNYGIGRADSTYGSGNYVFVGSGGGATHIAKRSGLLYELDDYRDDVIIVAGGGGGSTVYYTLADGVVDSEKGGDGGGYIGNKGYDNYYSGMGGQQVSTYGNSGYSSSTSYVTLFGKGLSRLKYSSTQNSGGGGGAGWYGGGGGMQDGTSVGAGGGGSGYINTNLLTDAYMYGYNVATSTDVDTLTYSVSSSSSYAVPNLAKYNSNGYAIITTDVGKSNISHVYYTNQIYYKTIESSTNKPIFTVDTSLYKSYQVSCDNDAIVGVSGSTIVVLPKPDNYENITCKLYHSYVEHGTDDSSLLINYDGINNEGSQHSTSTKVNWNNLANTDYTGTLYDTDYGVWSESGNAYWNDGYGYGAGVLIDGSENLLTDGSSFTLEAYIDPSGFSYAREVIANWQAGGYGIEIQTSGKVYFGIYSSTSSSYRGFTSSNALSTTGKYLITATWDGNDKMCLYINGEPVGSSNSYVSDGCLSWSTAGYGTAKFSPTSGTPMAVGCDPNASGYCATSGGEFYGYIHSARIYTKALTQEEIKYNYSVDKTRYGTS